MNYTKIRKMDISNGEGIRVTLFVQGCEFYCKGCFNAETWDFKGGKEFTDEIKAEFISIAEGKHIDGITILGGEPLHPNNVPKVLEIVTDYKTRNPNRTVWIYSGFSFEDLNESQMEVLDWTDVLVDGLFMNELKDPNLRFRGSSNQRVIDVQETLRSGSIVNYID